jgi:molybdate transport system permease protein
MASRLGDRLGGGLFIALTGITLVFLVLPIVGIFVHTTPGKLVGQLSNPVVHDAFVVTLKTSLIAQALILAFGTPTAYVIATRRFTGRSVAITLVELPLVMPPAVAGLGLIYALGRYHLLGPKLNDLGISLGVGTQAAVIVAVAYVASPLYVRQAIAAFEAVDPRLPAASRTLGAGQVRTFFRVMLPLARSGLIAGLAMSFARGVGEFGATIMFAGSLQHVTQTLSLAIYQEFDVNQDAALAMGGVLVIVSAVLLLTLRIALSWQRSPSNASPSLFGLSSSR